MNIIFQKFIKDPLNIGAITPSSRQSAKKIAEIINSTKTKNVIEIGGGTGVLSEYIQNKDLTIVERDQELCEILKQKYKKNQIIKSCGIEYLKSIKNNYGLLISIPLMKTNIKSELTNIINQHIEKKQIDWFIILGYRYLNQFQNIQFKNKKRHIIFNNIPPAFIWQYF
ncbi:MAG: hypothetical protein MRY23_04785 [Pelagibacteraceae bacterium]|nr:hypothetical protein [Pelagibacteraceae bacterium]MCI5079106.1 hypothetical protein [Pelagibacteraceae bacterium]